ncbi:hypothetical protein STEG23_028272 [Scotinomys teguina]
MTVTPLGWDQDCSLKIREPEVPAPFWFLDPGGWSKTAVVGLYFIFPGICTLSLNHASIRRAVTACQMSGWPQMASFPSDLSVLYSGVPVIEDQFHSKPRVISSQGS